MPTDTPGRVLLVIVALLGVALLTSVASAHWPGAEPADAPPANASAEEWSAWMEAHLTDEQVAWMEAHSGLTVEEMAQHMADEDGWDHHGPAGDGVHGPYGGGFHGPYGYGPHGPGPAPGGYGYCH